MRTICALPGLVAIAIASTAFAAEKELFSDVRAGAVFAPSGESSSTTSISGSEKTKVRDLSQLERVFREAGFSVEKDDNRTLSLKTTAGEWSLPVEITISEDGKQLTVAMFLSVVEMESTLTVRNVLAILEANRKYAPTSFAYNSEQKRFELDRVLPNEKITANVVRNTIDRLANVALETESLWNLNAKTKSSTSSQTAELDATAPSLSGRWSATRSKTEAFAIQFKADNTFDLVYVKSGKQTPSSGKFSLDGRKLTLEGKDGFRLTGTIKLVNDQEFQFLIENSKSPLVFKRAK